MLDRVIINRRLMIENLIWQSRSKIVGLHSSLRLTWGRHQAAQCDWSDLYSGFRPLRKQRFKVKPHILSHFTYFFYLSYYVTALVKRENEAWVSWLDGFLMAATHCTAELIPPFLSFCSSFNKKQTTPPGARAHFHVRLMFTWALTCQQQDAGTISKSGPSLQLYPRVVKTSRGKTAFSLPYWIQGTIRAEGSNRYYLHRRCTRNECQFTVIVVHKD